MVVKSHKLLRVIYLMITPQKSPDGLDRVAALTALATMSYRLMSRVATDVTCLFFNCVITEDDFSLVLVFAHNFNLPSKIL